MNTRFTLQNHLGIDGWSIWFTELLSPDGVTLYMAPVTETDGFLRGDCIHCYRKIGEILPLCNLKIVAINGRFNLDQRNVILERINEE